MSTRSYFVIGYGFSVEGIKIEDTLRFIQKHGADLMRSACNDDVYYAGIVELLMAIHNENIGPEYKITQDFAEVLEGLDISGNDDAYWGLDLVSDIINEEHDLQVSFEVGQDDCVGGPCMIIPAMMAWDYSDRVKNSDKLEISRLLGDYAKELGLDSEVTELEVEYFG